MMFPFHRSYEINFFVPTNGRSWGLALLWSDEIHIKIFASSAAFILATVDVADSPPWLFVGVYINPSLL